MKPTKLASALLLGFLALSAARADPVYTFRLFAKGIVATSAPVANVTGIIQGGSSATYADGTYATSCNAYLHPTGNYAYQGYTGDNYYTIKPLAAPSAFPVFCDMTADGGGWTRIGTFNGTIDSTLSLTNRNSIPYTQAKIRIVDLSTTKVITCHATPTTGFAPDNSAGVNCDQVDTDGNQYGIRVLQAGANTGGNYGFYAGQMFDTGGCNWGPQTIVFGRTFSGSGVVCANYSAGSLYSTATAWGSTMDWLFVR